LIRNKNETIDYVEGDAFLSDDKLFRILPDLDLEPLQNQQTKKRLQEKLETFKAKSIFAITHNRVDNPTTKHFSEFSLSEADQHRLTSMNVNHLDGDHQFKRAQEEARKQNYVDSRLLLTNILIHHPNHLDARILLARTFAWQQQYDTAITILEQVKNRAPSYPDTYAAISDVFYWNKDVAGSLKVIHDALKYDSLDPELRAREARGLLATGNEKMARHIVSDVLKKYPQNELAQDLNKKFK
jgi:lipoteichoic acid synthase